MATILIIDSGKGIQPLWLLAQQLEATPEYRDASEELCRRVEAALGAQGTHNIDRLLRVPGTTNFPNAKKKRQGRDETQARLVHASWSRYTWTRTREPRGAIRWQSAATRLPDHASNSAQ